MFHRHRTDHDVARLFDLHHASLYRYLVRLCGEPDLATDAAQEAFVRAVEHTGAREIERAWLFSVGTNVVLESRRTDARRTRLLAHGGARAPLADPPPDPHGALEAEEQRRIVRAALDTLSEKERIAVLMREEGFAHREIAAAIGTTTGSIGTLIARALSKLATTLDTVREQT